MTKRASVAVALAVCALALVLSPASAETVLIACDGDCADYEVYDSPKPPPYGVNCKYENASRDLDEISARPPQMHGLATYPNDSKVQWRMKVRRSASVFGIFSTIFASGWQTAYANDQEVANAADGFRRIRWQAPENPTDYYEVWVEMRWWKGGDVDGFARVEYDSYKWKWDGMSSGFGDEVCFPMIE